jgi:hypothetical protein
LHNSRLITTIPTKNCIFENFCIFDHSKTFWRSFGVAGLSITSASLVHSFLKSAREIALLYLQQINGGRIQRKKVTQKKVEKKKEKEREVRRKRGEEKER